MNIGAPKDGLKLPAKPRRIRWNYVKGAVAFICVAVPIGYVVHTYVLPKSTVGIRVTVAPVALEIAGPALLDARNRVTMTARIQGFLKAVNVDRNDVVKIGDALAELDSSDLANQLAAAEADAKAVESSIAEAQSDRTRAAALAEKAKQDYNRKINLHANQIISEADWSATEAAYLQTQADLARSTTTIAKATAQSASAEANVKLLRVRLSYATIKSPLNGVVVSRDRNVGDLLSPGTSLMQLVDPSSIILSARLDESAMGAIGPGQVATVHFASTPNDDFKGTVLRVIRLVDQETREFSLDIVLDQLPSHWALGQRASVVIKAPSLTPTIAIPQNLITRRNGRVGVWRLKNGFAEWALVDLGYPSGDDVQIVNGLNAGDVVLEPEAVYSRMPVALEIQQ